MISKPVQALIGVCLFLTASLAWALVIPSGGSLEIPPGGNINLGCTNLDLQGSLSVNSGQLSQATNVGIVAPGVLDGGTGAISVGGNWNNSGTFIPGTSTVTFVDGCTAAPAQLTGDTTFFNLTLISANGRTFTFPTGSHITVTGTLTLQGAPGFPIQLTSSSGQTAFIALGPNAHVVSSNANVPANVQIGTVVTSIPTLSQYGLIILALLLASMAAQRIKSSPLARRNAPM